MDGEIGRNKQHEFQPWDSRDGSREKPFATIAEGLKGAKPGDAVTVRAGVYREAVKVPSGAPGAPLTLRAEPGQRVVVSGFAAIGGWQPAKGGLFATTLDWRPDPLYVANTAQPLAREPNEGWYAMEAPDGGAVGSPIDVPAFRAGDFDGDGKRDLPELPPDVKAGLPDPNNEVLPSF